MKTHRKDWWWEGPALDQYLQSLVDAEFNAREDCNDREHPDFLSAVRASTRTRVEVVFNDRIRHCAFYYELFRRTAKDGLKQAPWHRLSETQQKFIIHSKLFPEHKYPEFDPNPAVHIHRKLQPGETGNFTVSKKISDGWSAPLILSVDYRKSTDAIMRNFRDYLESERSWLGIPEPIRNKGKNYKGPSWSFIEVFDQNIPGDESRRTRKSKARKLAQEHLTPEVIRFFKNLDKRKVSKKHFARPDFSLAIPFSHSRLYRRHGDKIPEMDLNLIWREAGRTYSARTEFEFDSFEEGLEWQMKRITTDLRESLARSKSAD